MDALIAVTALAVAPLVAWLLPRWQLRRALARPLDDTQLAILRRNVAGYARMSTELQHQLQRLVRQFLHQKKFIGCAGLEVTDEMRVTVAGQACLLLLNRPSRVFPRLHAILLYPAEFLVPHMETDGAGVVTHARQGRLGESWSDGRVVLSWDHVRRADHEPDAGQNVVLHEFAHQLDSESGSTNGAPYLGHPDSYRRWSQVLSRDYANLRRDAYYQQHTVIDHYGATSPAEFFAVATETFFEKPYAMAERHPELFDEFAKFYRVDPRHWVPAPEPPPSPDYRFAYGQWQ